MDIIEFNGLEIYSMQWIKTNCVSDENFEKKNHSNYEMVDHADKPDIVLYLLRPTIAGI